MSKYIDADKLIERLEEIKKAEYENCGGVNAKTGVLQEVQELISTLQQEQPDLPGIEDPGIPGKDFIPVEWVEACDRYGKWRIVKQEQPEVDIEKEIEEHAINMPHGEFTHESECIEHEEWAKREFHHFYELGRNARKSIWHNVAEEVPTDYGSGVIVACRNKNKEGGIWLYDLIQCWEGEWEPRVNWETPVKWAYVEDLDNARKEE